MILAPPLILPFSQAVGITAGGMGMIELTKRVSDYIRTNPEKSKEIIKLISPSAAGISTLFENKKREEDNNLPSPIKEEKTPQQEPPEDPNILPEIAKELTFEKVRSDVKFKQSKYKNTTDVFYKGKKYAEIEKRSDRPKFRGFFDYDLKFPSGYFLEDGEEVFETQDAEHGFKDAKEIMVNSILSDLKRNKKSMGGLIDKPLTGRSRDI
jgi:hypothetical protein